MENSKESIDRSIEPAKTRKKRKRQERVIASRRKIDTCPVSENSLSSIKLIVFSIVSKVWKDFVTALEKIILGGLGVGSAVAGVATRPVYGGCGVSIPVGALPSYTRSINDEEQKLRWSAARCGGGSLACNSR